MKQFLTIVVFAGLFLAATTFAAEGQPKKLILMAGKPSHPPRMHEFNAGVQLLAKCLSTVPSVKTEVVLNGWPKDEKIFEGADAVVFYMDGGAKHEAVQEGHRRLDMIDTWTKKGVGIGCMHYGVEVVAAQAGDEFKRWIGGYYENMFSCNPIWEPTFTSFLDHPITRGVKPFTANDEWYFNMRFITKDAGNNAEVAEGEKFTPILVAAPSDAVRDGPYVSPKGPYSHIQAEKGRAECMMWAVERPDGGRGFGFTGGHFHDNWGNDDYRKTILNSLVWLVKVDVPADGVESKITKADLDANLDKKPPPKAKAK
ncbi:MAG TPA: ThuA domain-containing protein [Pirellulaceae bacterium]